MYCVRIRSFSIITTTSPFVPSGLVCVYKPKEWSSSDVVMKIRNVMQIGTQNLRIGKEKCKIKVGHGGTLDPMAEGVLVIGVGEGTKLMGDYLAGPKGYRAIAMLGTEYDTLDCTGEVIGVKDCSHITLDTLKSVLPQYRGDILQTPPMYSALKRDGKKLYELAREGIEVEREARPVSVYKLEIANPISLPYFGLDIECSGGFYVRSLISDIGKSCDSYAHMTALIRTKQGQFELSDCLNQKDWNFDTISSHIYKCSLKAGIDPSKIKPAAII
jgi:tRNA pseudouridine55 synthase